MASAAVTSLLRALSLAGRPGRELAVRLDLVRSVGVGHAWRRFRADSGGASPSGDEVHPAYAAIWSDAAAEVGAELAPLGGGFAELRRGEARARVWNHWVPLDDGVTLRLALEKTLVHRLLADAAVPVPAHLEFDLRDRTRAHEFLHETGGACVVKPVDTSGGSGATSGVETAAQLDRAIIRARRLHRRLLIERQVPGDVYRLLFLDGELLDVLRRRPPHVTGDGRSTLDGLIAAENARRADAAAEIVDLPLRVDLDCILTLERQGLRLTSIPAVGQEVAVKTVTSQNRVEDNETFRGDASALAADARRAVEAVGLRLAGVDAVTTDPARTLAETGGAVIEVNGTPGLHYHYEVADRRNATRVAVPVAQALLQWPPSTESQQQPSPRSRRS